MRVLCAGRLTDLVNTVKQVHANLNRELRSSGCACMFDPASPCSSRSALRRAWRQVFDSVIPHRNVRLAEAPSYGLPGVVFLTPSSKGARRPFRRLRRTGGVRGARNGWSQAALIHRAEVGMARGQPLVRQRNKASTSNRLGQMAESHIARLPECFRAACRRSGATRAMSRVPGLLFQRLDQIEASCRPGSGRPTSCRGAGGLLVQCRGPVSGATTSSHWGAHLEGLLHQQHVDFVCLPRRAREWV